MHRQIWLFIVLTAVGAAALSAQALSVAYVQGSVQANDGSGWSEVSIGDTIPGGATVRLGDGSYVEMTASGVDITLSQAGSYPVASLLSTSRRMGGTATSAVLTTALAALVGKTPATHSTAMGVRSENMGAALGPAWVTSDSQVYLDAGKDFLKAGSYAKAVEQLQSALAEASDQEIPEVKYYLATAYSLSGNEAKALGEIADVAPSEGDSWAPDFALLKARLLIDSFAFKQAASLLQSSSADLAHNAQRARLLLSSRFGLPGDR